MHVFIERPLLAIKDSKRDVKDLGVKVVPGEALPPWPVAERTTL
jgi:hypothetical protein